VTPAIHAEWKQENDRHVSGAVEAQPRGT